MTDESVRIAVLEERQRAMTELVRELRDDVDALERTTLQAQAIGRQAADAALRRLALGGFLIALGGVGVQVAVAVWG